MQGADRPPPSQESRANARRQIVLCSAGAAPDGSSAGNVRRVLRMIALTGTSAMRYLFSPANLKTCAKAIGIAAIVLVAVAIFIGPAGWPGTSSGRLDAIELAVRRLETRLVARGASRTEVANPTTLLVAIQFVTAAAERSTPFDTALAVAISMTGEHSKIGPLLDKLLIEAPAGVPSVEDLRREFQAKLAEFESAGVFTADGGGTGPASFRISRFFGMAEPDISADQRATLKQASGDVAGQNLGQAVQLITKLDGRLREGLEGWREKAQRRVAVDAILGELRRATFTDLIDDAS